MKREDIEQLMQEAGLKTPAGGDFIFIHWDQIALLIQHEREECAKVCEQLEALSQGEDNPPPYRYYEAIRARGQK
jgi:hypothetical protein